MSLVGNVFHKRSKWLLSLPMTVRELWGREYHDSRIILEQQGDLRYFSVTARLQQNVVRGLIVLGLSVVSGFIILAMFSLLLMAGNAKTCPIVSGLMSTEPDLTSLPPVSSLSFCAIAFGIGPTLLQYLCEFGGGVASNGLGVGMIGLPE